MGDVRTREVIVDMTSLDRVLDELGHLSDPLAKATVLAMAMARVAKDDPDIDGWLLCNLIGYVMKQGESDG